MCVYVNVPGAAEPCNTVLQKFVKSKGRKPCFTRLFWKLPPGGSRSVVGWTMSTTDDFAAPPSNVYGSIRPEDIHVDLKNHLYQGPSERAQLKVKDAKNFQRYGHLNMCSLTNAEGVVTDAEMDHVTPFKMSPATLQDPEAYTERIVAFLQKHAEMREGLVISVTEIVCDFIKDDSDKWWFIQIKGLRLCRRSRQLIHRWIVRKAEADHADLEDFDDKQESFQEQYQRKIREAREKAKDNMDNKCKMCGIYYAEGELMSRTSLEAFDTTEDEEKQLEQKLINQQKVEQQNQQQHRDTLKREKEEFSGGTTNTLPNGCRTSLRHTLSENVLSPDGRRLTSEKSPLKASLPPKLKPPPPRNPSFAELKKETDLRAIAQEEGVDVDMVSCLCGS